MKPAIRSLPGNKFYLLYLVLAFLITPFAAFAQCSDWYITAQITSASTCTANGNFSVSVAGPDASNITNLQYAIPISANGFSVPLNNSASFSGIPPGTYQVSAVGSCGGTFVGKNTSIHVPGNYTPPTLNASVSRYALDCAATGIIGINISNGLPPYSITMTSSPATYSGPASFNATGHNYSIGNLPNGIYTIQIVDACGSGSSSGILNVGALIPTTLPLNYDMPYSNDCDVITIPKPYVVSGGTSWFGYEYDNSIFDISVEISGNISGPTPFENLPGNPFNITLPPGINIKDCYGKTVTFTIQPPCGPSFTLGYQIPYPAVSSTADQHCNTNFKGHLGFGNLVCLPLTYSFQNTATGQNYGPYTTSVGIDSTPFLPLGYYSLSYVTGDGYNGTGSFAAYPITGNPYSVTVINGETGLHNFIEGFGFTTTATSLGQKTVELFSGPSGYSFNSVWYDYNVYFATQNQTPGPATLFFPAGNYVWKITDNCGTYYLPITVGAPDLYQFTAGIGSQLQTCNGLLIWPSGTATNNGQNMSVNFHVLRNGVPDYQSGTGMWPSYPLGSPILINKPGVYTLLPSVSQECFYDYYTGYPNPYTVSFEFTYDKEAVQVDINQTQGFLCKGDGPGQGKIFVKGKEGIPYQWPVHYQYFLAQQGQGLNGPYLANNTSGQFSNFGGNANGVYDVKIVDSCGAFAIQQIKILDLQATRLISASSYVGCEGTDVQLHASWLPGATYSWTGPNGFSSALQNPVIEDIDAQSIGAYYVTVTTPVCNQSVQDSTIITMAPNPVAPIISLSCNPLPVYLEITNPDPAYQYSWNVIIDIYGSHIEYQEPSDSAYIKYTHFGSFYAIATDTTTGCQSISDSMNFASDPNVPLEASIYSPHLQLCPGDTTILVAQGTPIALSYQWFLNGIAIPGATNESFVTATPGNYKLAMTTGPCTADTSEEVTVIGVQPPIAAITASALSGCEGDPIVLQANTGTGYSYTWHQGNSTVPGAQSDALNITSSGTYYVTIANGGCIANSNAITITIDPLPVVSIMPNTTQYLCTGDVVNFSTPFNAAYTYTWTDNNITIPGAGTNSYSTATAGIYAVNASTPLCPSVTSVPVAVIQLPEGVDLANDTVICQPGPFAMVLSVDPLFDQVMWSTGATTDQITVNASGKYWVRANDACGVFSDTMRITTLYDYAPALPSDTLICNAANTAVLSVPGGLQNVVWSNGVTGSSITITQPGIYRVEGNSPCGILRDTVDVSFCPPVIQALQLSDDSLCAGDCISVSGLVANYPQQYQWSFPGGNPSASNATVPGIICYQAPGSYTITLNVSNAGGTDVYSTNIQVMSKPVPRFEDTVTVLSYKSRVLLPACADAITADWYRDDTLVCENCSSLPLTALDWQSVYRCVVKNGDCRDTCTYKVLVTDIPSDLWLPDAFSPNGDGKNDRFTIITDNPNISITDLSIYNRWGQRVYWGNDRKGWDGSLRNIPAETGTYFWRLQYHVTGNNTQYSKKGELMLVR
jgi:gliding motility-associated-like protein